MSPAQLLKGDTKIKSWYDENGMKGNARMTRRNVLYQGPKNLTGEDAAATGRSHRLLVSSQGLLGRVRILRKWAGPPKSPSGTLRSGNLSSKIERAGNASRPCSSRLLLRCDPGVRSGGNPPDRVADIVGDQQARRACRWRRRPAGPSALPSPSRKPVRTSSRQPAAACRRRTARRSPCSRCAACGSTSRAGR